MKTALATRLLGALALLVVAAGGCAREPFPPGAPDAGPSADAADPADLADATDDADAPCPHGQLLYNGRCVLPCTTDGDCPSRACTTSIGKCLDPPPGCAPAADCSPDVCWGACVEPAS